MRQGHKCVLWHLREVISHKYVVWKTEQIKVEITYIHSKKYSTSKMDSLITSQIHASTPLKNLTVAEVDMNFHFHNGRPMIPILNWKNLVHPFPSYLFKIHFNITLPFTLRSFIFLELCKSATFFCNLLKSSVNLFLISDSSARQM